METAAGHNVSSGKNPARQGSVFTTDSGNSPIRSRNFALRVVRCGFSKSFTVAKVCCLIVSLFTETFSQSVL
jgi:hypothetical protein